MSSPGISIESLQKENQRLQSINSELTTQNSSLRAQIDSSLKITEKIQEVYKENADLKSNLRQSQEERGNLEKRLQINLQQISELNDRLNAPKGINESFVESARNNESELRSKISDLNEKLALSNLKNEQLSKEKEKCESDISQIYEKASHFFNDDIKYVTDLFAHFDKKREIEHRIQVQPQNTQKNVDKAKYVKKINKLKMMLQNETKKTQEIENEYNANLRKMENTNELKLIELNSRIEKASASLEQQRKMNADLNLKNEELNKENARLESQLQLSKIKVNDTESEKVIQLTRQISDLNDKISDLQEINQEFKNNKIPNLVSKNRNLNSKLAASTEKVSQLKEMLADEQSKINILSEQFEKRSIDLTERISQRDAENSKLKHDIDKLKTNLMDASRDMKQASMENETLQEEKENLSKLLKQHKEMNQKFENQLFEYSQKVSLISTELENTRTKLRIAEQPVDVSKLLPLACWSVPEIPQDLTIVIEDIVKNSTLELPTKLRHVLSVICKWFISKTDRLEKDNNILSSNTLELKGLLETTKEFFKQTFSDYKGDFNDIIENNDTQTKELFKDFIEKKNESFNNLFELKTKMDEDLLDLLLALHVDQIGDAHSKVEKLYSKNRKLKASLQKAKVASKKIANIHIKETKSMQQNLNSKDAIIEELNSKISILTNSLEKSENSNKQHEAKISELKAKIHEKIQQANESIQNSKKKFDNLTRKFNDLTGNYEEALHKINELEATIDDLHDVINDLTNNKKELESSIEELKGLIEQTKNHFKTKIKQLKQQSQGRYDTMIEQMKKQNAECRETITKLNTENLNMNDKNEMLENIITELNLKIQKLEMKATAMMADSGRDKRAQESQFTARLMSLKNDYQNQIEESINEKKKLIDLIRVEFSKYVSIDERNIEDAIKKVSGRLRDVDGRQDSNSSI